MRLLKILKIIKKSQAKGCGLTLLQDSVKMITDFISIYNVKKSL